MNADDLTEEELAAQDGAYDAPEADVPILSDAEVALDPLAFIVHLGGDEPQREEGGYGVPAVRYSDKLGAYVDTHPQRAYRDSRSADELDLSPFAFLVRLRHATPHRGPDDFGLTAVQYRDKLAAYADRHCE